MGAQTKVEFSTELQIQIAYVLLIDLVGYSRMLMNEQLEAMHKLNRLVRKTQQFQAAERAGKLIRLPAGDGVARTGSVTLLYLRSSRDAHGAARVRPPVRPKCAAKANAVITPPSLCFRACSHWRWC